MTLLLDTGEPAKTAREKFAIGDRVRLSELGMRSIRRMRKLQARPGGEVTGFTTRREWCVLVRVDGLTKARSFSMDFWDVEPGLSNAKEAP